MKHAPWIAVGLLLLAAAAGSAAPVAVSPEVHSDVVTSVAASARVYGPQQLPMTGRNCAEVLDDLRGRADFRGEIRSVYPSSDETTCYRMQGRQEQVAVVCCAPSTEPSRPTL